MLDTFLLSNLVTFIRSAADIDPLGRHNGCVPAGGCVQYQEVEEADVRRRVCLGTVCRLGSDQVACAGHPQRWLSSWRSGWMPSVGSQARILC